MGEIYWRDSQRSLRFFIFDAKSAIFILIFIFHPKLWTFLLVIFAMIFFWLLERRGLNFTTAGRTIRCFFIGNKRPRQAKLEKTKMKDFG